jgi:limonene-1,2-epoxide hydrolase
MNDDRVTRRGLAGLGAVALAGMAGIRTAQAAEMTAAEKANVALVNAFCKSWGDKATTVEKVMESMTADCTFKVNGQPETRGREAVAALFKTFFKDGTRYKMEIHETFAKGPVVVHSRTDTTMHTDKNDPPGPIVGIYVFKDGKISEWEEVIYKA